MNQNKKITYTGPVEHSIEVAIEKIENILEKKYAISKRAIALLLIQGDQEIKELVRNNEPNITAKIEEIVKELQTHYANPLEYEIAIERRKEASRIANKVLSVKTKKIQFREKLSYILMAPITGIPILIVVLYWGLYKFVGDFGAGVVVDFIEGEIFQKHINPFVTNIFTDIVPWQILQNLFIGEYGIITLSFRYAFALILPIVTFFFIVFSIIEDTGYLPRLAMLIDRTFKKIGLSGRAVIPMVLGFGCTTMATMVTRTLPTKRERIISTILLALAVPCSAQLGIILALLEGNPKAMFLWAGVVTLVFLLIGYLSAKILPGEKPSFYMELPPLRLPIISNIITKTFVRVKWYLKEVLPLFLLASVFIWLGNLVHLFELVTNMLRKPVSLIGLPPETAKVFIFGFFRRDYGAAGLYDLNKQGLLTGNQLLISCITLTLFLPCIAQFLMNIKERGIKTAFAISGFVLFLSFGVAYIINLILTNLGVIL